MLVIAALQENQGQPIKASHIVTDVYIKKAIKEEVMSDPVNQLLQIKFDWPVRLANGYRDPHLLPTAMIRYMVVVLARPIFCGVLASCWFRVLNNCWFDWGLLRLLLVQGTEQLGSTGDCYVC